MKKLHKIVNGLRIELSDEEEVEIRAQWKKNEDERQQREEKKRQKKLLKDTVKGKLSGLGLTEEEISTIIK